MGDNHFSDLASELNQLGRLLSASGGIPDAFKTLAEPARRIGVKLYNDPSATPMQKAVLKEWLKLFGQLASPYVAKPDKTDAGRRLRELAQLAAGATLSLPTRTVAELCGVTTSLIHQWANPRNRARTPNDLPIRRAPANGSRDAYWLAGDAVAIARVRGREIPADLEKLFPVNGHIAPDVRLQHAANSERARNAPPAKPQEHGIGKSTLALALLAQHPEWSDGKIAEHAGCHRTSLYRMLKFRRARELLREHGKRRMPNGSKGRDANLEAWERDDE